MLEEIRNPLPMAARGLPESELIPDADAARAVRRRLERTRRHEMGIIGVLAWTPVLIALSLGLYIVIDQLIMRLIPPMPQPIDFIVGSLVPIAIALTCATWIQRHVAGLAVREVLLERGIPVCLGCGYDLSLVPAHEPRCPECGRIRTDPAFSAREAHSPDHSDKSDSHTV